MPFTVSSCARGFAILTVFSLLNESAASGDDLDKYTWVLVCAGILAFFAAYGIGANDVANAYATSVGAKSITVRQAVLLAAVFEFLGAVTMGSQVAKTVRKGIADVDCFEDNPGLLMYGMTCVIMAVGIWLLLASYLEMPVSTTHSCVGGIVGMTMMARGSECVVWNEPVDECTFDNFPCVKGVSAIVVSWVLSPVASGICASIIYFLTYHLVLKDAETSFQRAKYAFPLIVGFTIGVNAMFFVLKGTKSKAEELGTDDIVQEAKAGNLGPVAIVGAISFACAAAVTALITPYLSGKVEETVSKQQADAAAGIEEATEGKELKQIEGESKETKPVQEAAPAPQAPSPAVNEPMPEGEVSNVGCCSGAVRALVAVRKLLPRQQWAKAHPRDARAQQA